jgi:hypothetical protein
VGKRQGAGEMREMREISEISEISEMREKNNPCLMPFRSAEFR